MKFRINRKTWARGLNTFNTGSLQNSDGTKCCLGFYAKACGVPTAELRACGYLNAIGFERTMNKKPIPEGLFRFIRKRDPGTGKKVEEKAVSINDSTLLTEPEREQMLTKLFKSVGVEVEFYGRSE